MLQPSTVVGPGTFIMVALCALGMGFMVRFFIALARDGRKVRVGSGQAPAARLALGVCSELRLHWPRIPAVNDGAGGWMVRRSLRLRRGFGSAIRLRSSFIGWARASDRWEKTFMRDVIYVAVTIAFFLISIGYVKFCDRIR
jgi:hypothetical protein